MFRFPDTRKRMKQDYYFLFYCYYVCWFLTVIEGWVLPVSTTTTTATRIIILRRRRNKSIRLAALCAKKSPSVLTLDHPPKETAKSPQAIVTKESITTPLPFWHNTSDAIIFHYDHPNTDTLTGLQFRIRGNPMPLQRHRQTRRGFVYNPSSSAQAAFRQVLETQLLEKHSLQQPLFKEIVPLHVSCQFHMKRSLSDFVANTRGRPLKASKRTTSQWSTKPRTPDVDNLAKFVLDSFNGVLYADDQQIVSLSVMKLRDNQGDCLGYTDIHVSVVTDDDSMR